MTMANNRDLGKITIQLELLTAKFEQASKQSEAELGKLGNRLKSINAPLAGLQTSLVSAAAGFVSLNSAMKVLSVGAQFEDAFAGVVKTVSASPEALETLRGTLVDLSKELPISATELANVAAAAGQLGIKTPMIAEFTETMSKLGLATNLTSTQGADSLARFANVTGMSQDSFDNLASTIVALGNNMATTEAEITEMATRLAATGTQVGMSEAQIVAFAATLSSLGIEAEAGGSAFSKLFSDIALATARGGDSLKQFATVSGQTTAEFADLFKRDAAGAVQAFLEGLNQLKGDGTGAIKILDDMGMSEVRLSRAVLSTAGSVGKLNEAMKLANEAWTANKALEDETEKRLVTLNSQWDILKNRVSAVSIELIKSLAPGLVTIMQLAGEATELLSAVFGGGDIQGHGQNLAKLAADVDQYTIALDGAKQAQEAVKDAWINAEGRQKAQAENVQHYTEKLREAEKAQADYLKGLGILNDMETKHAATVRKAQEALDKANQDVKRLAEEEKARRQAELDALAKSQAAQEKYASALDGVKEKLANLKQEAAQLDLKKGFDDAIASMDQVSFDKLSLKMLEGLKRAEQQALPEAVRGSKIGEELANQIATANWSKAMKPLVDEFEAVGEELTFAIEESQAFEALRTGIAEAAGEGMAQGLDTSSVDALMASGLTGMGMGQEMADGIVGGLNAGLQALANGGDWGDAAQGVGVSIGNSILPGLGDLGNLLGSIDYGELFGGKDAGTEARQNIESFLEDTLKANFETGGYIQEGWAEKFQLIAGDGATAFEAVGTALAALAGQSAEYGGQIGYILAENLNGNLESLPFLLDSLGISLESMAAEFEKIGIAGELSWAQLEVLYAGLDEATNRGIAGVGDLVGAYATLEMSGGRGAMAIEGLRQVAIEAQEAGAESLQQLQGVMSQLGFSQEEIDRMISVLQSRGIENMQQLETASTRTLGSIIAGLEGAGLQWEQYGQGVDSAIDKVTALEEKIMGIQSRDIDINVNVNYSSSGEPPKANALGNAFDGNGLVKLAKGGVITSPTYFNSKNYSGVMGEAGAEAVMPLRRTANGELGVIGGGGSTGDIVVNVYAPNSQAGVSSEIIQAIKSVHRKSVYDAVNTVVTMHRQGAL
jgi:TP901 family phage tail tape measure protein